ncbi:MAG TPA: hypothetical protein VGX00_07975 [Thermoplasmata archaeon]|nr:hypothetical protein [Thermoplasmata archaeon]
MKALSIIAVIFFSVAAIDALSLEARAMPAMSPAYSINPCSPGSTVTTPTLYGDVGAGGSSFNYGTGYQDSSGASATASLGNGYTPPGNPSTFESKIQQIGEMALAAPIYNNISCCDELNYAGGGTSFAVASFTLYYQYSGSLSVACLTGDPNPADYATATAAIWVSVNLWDTTSSSYAVTSAPSQLAYSGSLSRTNGSPGSNFAAFSGGPTKVVLVTPQFTLHANNAYLFVLDITTTVYAEAVVASLTDHTTSGTSDVTMTDVNATTVSCPLC